MAWQRNYLVLSSGERVRFAFLKREDVDAYYIRFRGPNGNRLKKSTGRMKKADAIDAAHRLIFEEYGQLAPTSETVGWDVATTKLTHAMEADGKRPRPSRATSKRWTS